MTKPTKVSPKQPPRPPVVEWIVAGLGLLGFSTAFGLILVQALSGPARLADLSISAWEARSSGSGWVVDFEAANAGDKTAAAVEIEGRLGAETAKTELDYVPGHGTAAASLRFDEDPRQGLELIVLGWREP